jgi:hypothetical protein
VSVGAPTVERMNEQQRSESGVTDDDLLDATENLPREDQPMATPQPEGEPQGEMIGATEPGEGGAVKDPETWVTGDEPMTASQKSYLSTLAQEAGETLPADLTKAEASEHIERLQQTTGRGQ